MAHALAVISPALAINSALGQTEVNRFDQFLGNP